MRAAESDYSAEMQLAEAEAEAAEERAAEAEDAVDAASHIAAVQRGRAARASVMARKEAAKEHARHAIRARARVHARVHARVRAHQPPAPCDVRCSSVCCRCVRPRSRRERAMATDAERLRERATHIQAVARGNADRARMAAVTAERAERESALEAHERAERLEAEAKKSAQVGARTHASLCQTCWYMRRRLGQCEGAGSVAVALQCHTLGISRSTLSSPRAQRELTLSSPSRFTLSSPGHALPRPVLPNGRRRRRP